MHQVRPSVKSREHAQESVDSARAVAREGVRLRNEAAAERAREGGGVGPPFRSRARSDTRTYGFNETPGNLER